MSDSFDDCLNQYVIDLESKISLQQSMLMSVKNERMILKRHVSDLERRNQHFTSRIIKYESEDRNRYMREKLGSKNLLIRQGVTNKNINAASTSNASHNIDVSNQDLLEKKRKKRKKRN